MLFVFTSWVHAATKIYLPSESPAILPRSGSQIYSTNNLNLLLGLTSREDLKLLAKKTDKNDTTHYRYQQMFNGIPVWGHHILVAKDPSGQVVSLYGTRVSGISDDINPIMWSPVESPSQSSLFRMKQRHIQNNQRAGRFWIFKNEFSRKMVYIDDKGQARICYVVSFFVDLRQGGSPSRPTIIIDAGTGEILKKFDALAYAQGVGPGGNIKTGQYLYGQDLPAFEVAESDMLCTMHTDKLKTWNMHHSTAAPTVHEFECYENTFKEINGGFCPLNDAHYFGSVVHDMYNDWFGMAPVPFELVVGVHYSSNFHSAFWSGTEAIFGDGDVLSYPLVGINTISHEISHGFTEQNSNLIRHGQSGGINESFSDMAGEAAEYYLRGSNDFMLGRDIWKGTGAFRYMDDPPKDGWSIDSANDYYEGMPLHHSSGVFNKAFYTLATTAGWDTRMAFEVFVKANQHYWEPSTNFIQGAQGAYIAAIHLGYPAQDVKAAFEVVDIFIDVEQNVNARFTYATDSLTATFTDQSTCSGCSIVAWSWEFGDGSQSTQQHPTHTYANNGAYIVTLTVTDSSGQTDTESKPLTIGQDSGEYCESEGQVSYYHWVKKVALGEFINTSTAGGYSDFTYQEIKVHKESPYALTLSPGPPGTPFQKFWRVWADLNHDGDFVDAGEMLFEGSGTDEVAGEIMIPMTAIEGSTRLRISSGQRNYPNPCGEFYAGEVEDYTFKILERIPDPVKPSAMFSYVADELTVSFTDRSTAGDAGIVGWHWDFGDGSESSQQNPTRTYSTGGTYTVTLTVTDSNELTDTETDSLQISEDPPPATYRGLPAQYLILLLH